LGFKRYLRSQIVVEVQQQVVMNPLLQVGGIAEAVEVNAETPLIQPTTSSSRPGSPSVIFSAGTGWLSTPAIVNPAVLKSALILVSVSMYWSRRTSLSTPTRHVSTRPG
jgi:hypothetical protein